MKSDGRINNKIKKNEMRDKKERITPTLYRINSIQNFLKHQMQHWLKHDDKNNKYKDASPKGP